MTQALYFKPSYDALKNRISAAAPGLDVALYDEEGRIHHGGREVGMGDINPEYFWIHGDLFKSPARLKDYFRLMQESQSIRWLHTINTGLDLLPYRQLLEQGVRITNNHGQALAIAEFVIAQVLAYYQNIYDFRRKQEDRIWKQRGFREISGTHWLLVGFGHIGRLLAQRLKPFGVTITAVRRSNSGEGLAERVVQQGDLPRVLPDADVVVLACASNDATRNLVGGDFLAQMKPGSVLVNVARGDLVDEDALRRALDAGKPEYAILDVFRQEPLPPDAWFWEHPRVQVTPHTSNGGSGMRERSVETFLDNLQRMMQGKALQNEVTRDSF